MNTINLLSVFCQALLSLTIACQETFIQTYPNLGNRLPVSRIISDQEEHVYALSNLLDAHTFNITKFSPSGNVISDVTIDSATFLTLELFQDSIFVFGQYMEDMDLPNPFFLKILDTALNEIFSVVHTDSVLGRHGYFAPPVSIGDTLLVATNTVNPNSNEFWEIYILQFLRNGTFLDKQKFEFPGSKVLDNFSRFRNGYMLAAPITDSIGELSLGNNFFRLDRGFHIEHQYNLHKLDYPVDTPATYSAQEISGRSSFNIQNGNLVILSSSRNLYLVQGIGFFNDADPVMGILPYGDTAFSEFAHFSDVHENEYATFFGLSQDVDGNLFFAAAAGVEAQIGYEWAENTDSRIRVYSVDDQLLPRWEKTFFEGDGKYQRVHSMLRTSSGNLILAGTEFDPAMGGIYLFLVKTDSTGNFINGVKTSRLTKTFKSIPIQLPKMCGSIQRKGLQ